MWWVSLALFGLLGGIWALSSPLMSVPDEPAHAIKAAAVWRGEIRGDTIGLAPGDVTGVSSKVVDRVPLAYAELHHQPDCFKGRPGVSAACAPSIGTDGNIVGVGSPAGTYPPLYYILVGWPSRMLSPYRALYAMRACSVLLGALLLASATASASALARRPVVTLGVGLALTPTALFLIGSVNPNGFEVAAAVATWVTLLDVLTRPGGPTPRLLARAAVASVCFLLARPISPLFWAVVVALVLVAAFTRERGRLLRADRAARWAGAAVASAAVVAVGWLVWSPSSESVGLPGVSLGTAAVHSMGQIPTEIQQMVGVFGWLDTPTADVLSRVWVGLVVLVVLLALVVGSARQRLALVATAVVVFALPVAIETAGVHQLGYFWQGRYSLPLVAGIPLMATWIIARARRFALPLQVGMAVMIGAGVGAVQFIAHGTALSRYARGGPTSSLAYRWGGSWLPFLTGSQLFVLALVVFGLYGVGLALAGSSGGDGVEVKSSEVKSFNAESFNESGSGPVTGP